MAMHAIKKYEVMMTEQIVLASRPKGTPGNENLRFENTSLAEMKDDEVELEAAYS